MLKRALFMTVATALLLAGCKEKQSPAETASHFKAAKDLFAAKDYSRALVEVQGAIKGDPRNGEFHYLAAQIQDGLGNTRSAIEEYARAAAPDANSYAAQIKFEEILIDANQLDMAIGKINGTLGSKPNDPDALALRALALQRQGNMDKARADAQASLARAPAQPNAISVMATDAIATKNPDKALTILAVGLKAQPEQVTLLRLKAAALLIQDKKDEAIAIYDNLVRSHPTNGVIRAASAELYATAGKVDVGEKILRDGLATTPTAREGRMMLVAYLAKHRGDAAADAELQQAIKDSPQDSVYDLARAELQTRAGQSDEAIKTLQAAMTRVSEGQARAALQIALAKLEVGEGDVADARRLLDDAIAAKADNDDALLLRAGLMIQADDAAHAIPDLLAIAGRRPRSAPPLDLLAEAYLRQGDTDKAIDALKKVAYFEPTNIVPVGKLANLSLQQNKPDVAKQVITDFIKQNPDNLDGRVALIRLAVQQKDWAGAQAAIDAMSRVPKADRAVPMLTAEMNEAKSNPAAAAAAYARLNGPTKPVDRDALIGYARSSVAAKQTDQAIATIAALADQKTGDEASVADLVLSSLYRSAGQNDKADAALDSATAAAPKQAVPYLEAAIAAGTAQPDKAVAALNAGLAAGAPQEPLMLARADLEDRLGKKDTAIATYQAVLKINPRSLIAANNYGSLVADAKPADKPLLSDAREPLKRFAEGDNPAVLDTLAWLDYRLGDYQAAKALLTRAKADSSKNAQLRFHYGAVLIALGDKDAGRSVLQSALSGTFPGRAEAEKMLTQ